MLVEVEVTVAELISYLRTMPQDVPVIVASSFHERESIYSPLVDISVREYLGDHRLGGLGETGVTSLVLWPNVTNFDKMHTRTP